MSQNREPCALRSIELMPPNDTSALAVARNALDPFGAEQHIPAELVIDLQVVLDEIVSQGHQICMAAGRRARVPNSAHGRTGAVEVTVIDDGQPYDPREAPVPERAAPSCRPQPGGRGICMTRQLVDGFDDARTVAYNRVALTKRVEHERGERNGR